MNRGGNGALPTGGPAITRQAPPNPQSWRESLSAEIYSTAQRPH